MSNESTTRLLIDVGRLVRDGRLLARLSQQELAARSRVTQSRISRIERGRCPTVRYAEVDRLFVTLGVRYRIDASLATAAPFVRDAVHIRCATYAQRRLEADGWLVRREVRVGDGRHIGWIDLVAFHPLARVLLVIEIKTELRDLGAIERSLNGYLRDVRAVASSFGWRPRAMSPVLLVLTTATNDEAIRANRAVLDAAFPGRAADLRRLVSGRPTDRERFIATIDPRSRRRLWLVPTVIDGRRSAAPYADYIDAARALESRRAS
jgi:transcriptional regulator with XRE-family HTH domain